MKGNHKSLVRRSGENIIKEDRRWLLTLLHLNLSRFELCTEGRNGKGVPQARRARKKTVRIVETVFSSKTARPSCQPSRMFKCMLSRYKGKRLIRTVAIKRETEATTRRRESDEIRDEL